MKEKFSRIRSPWHRLYITLLIFICYCRDKFFKSSRSRMHWLGSRTRQRRPHRAFILLTFALAILSLEPYEIMVWSVAVGGATSCMVTARSVYLVVNRRRAHWVRQRSKA